MGVDVGIGPGVCVGVGVDVDVAVGPSVGDGVGVGSSDLVAVAVGVDITTGFVCVAVSGTGVDDGVAVAVPGKRVVCVGLTTLVSVGVTLVTRVAGAGVDVLGGETMRLAATAATTARMTSDGMIKSGLRQIRGKREYLGRVSVFGSSWSIVGDLGIGTPDASTQASLNTCR